MGTPTNGRPHKFERDWYHPQRCVNCGLRADDPVHATPAPTAPPKGAPPMTKDTIQEQLAYSAREMLELCRMTIRAQLREERINSYGELHGLLRHIDAILSEPDALQAENARLTAELSAVADFAESHWRGAGLPLSSKWIIEELAGAQNEASRETARLTARIVELEEALRPLADEADEADEWYEMGDTRPLFADNNLTVADVRRARKALEG